MRWPSPWGNGFPGWHLECTVMSTKYLGEQFDIHGGGMDLKFPHHECEIAQGKTINEVDPVKYWMHANMLTLNGKKMSKSTGNHLLPNEIFSGDNEILSKAYSPAVVRFFMLQAHYRNMLDLSEDALLAAEKGYKRLMEVIQSIDELPVSEQSDFEVDKWIESLYNAMDDDFNTPILIANLFEGARFVNQVKAGKAKINKEDKEKMKKAFNDFAFEVLGLHKSFSENGGESVQAFDKVIQLLIEMRNQARADKNWELSDKIRDELAKNGVILKDGKEGTTYTFK